MRPHLGARANAHMGSNHGVRPNAHVGVELGAGCNQGRGVNQGGHGLSNTPHGAHQLGLHGNLIAYACQRRKFKYAGFHTLQRNFKA